jgi:thiamine-monophosphate kinase
MFENTKRTELSELGEFGLIKHLTSKFNLQNKSSVLGIGDDADILKHTGQTLVTQDLLLEGIHFDLTYAPLKHLGYKAAIVNFSDVIAMNGKPEQMIIGLGASNRFSVEALEELYEGFQIACQKYKVDLVGGDTVSSQKGLVLSITALGSIKKDKAILRSGAKAGDLIFVSGDLGAAYMGLIVLEREKQTFIANPKHQPDLQKYDYVVERQLKPEARIDILNILKKKGIEPTSMIDISDGLASELKHLCTSSKKGCNIYEDKIPIDPVTINTAEEFNISPLTAALNGGEDYELLFTISQEDFEKLKEEESIHVIGHVTESESEMNLISNKGEQISLQAQGWNAFDSKQSANNQNNNSSENK